VTNTTRTELLRRLAELSEILPDVRFGQLIVNLSYRALAPTVEAPWDVEDDQLLVAVEQQIADLSDRRAEVA